METQFIIKLGNTGPEIGRLNDHEKVAPVILDLIRRGLVINYSHGGAIGGADTEAPQLPAPKPVLLADLRTPEQTPGGRGQARRGTRSKIHRRNSVRLGDHIAGAPKWVVGDGVYLAWSMLDDDLQLRLSTYRTTRGEVAAKRPGHHSVGVRFNGDPELVWLKPIHVTRSPEAE